MQLNPLHREILQLIGLDGARPETLLRYGREFAELERQGLVCYWPQGAPRPAGLSATGWASPGLWYLTSAGFAELGDGPPLRFV